MEVLKRFEETRDIYLFQWTFTGRRKNTQMVSKYWFVVVILVLLNYWYQIQPNFVLRWEFGLAYIAC